MIQKVINKQPLCDHNEMCQNRQYWLSRPASERLAAVEFYRRQVYGNDYPQRLKELLELLNSHKVEYMVVGAYALALHGSPRFTGDLDIYLKPDMKNASLVLAVLKEFGFGSLELVEEDFTKSGQVIQLGVPPVRIIFLTSLKGLSWQEAVEGQLEGELGGIPVMFLGKEQYIRNKRALGRQKDLADAEVLEADD